MSRRTEMLASTFQREIAMVIMRELSDPRITQYPAITRVVVAEDLSTAEVFVTMMGTPGQRSAALHALQSAAGMIRRKVGKGMRIHSMPVFSFKYDEQLSKEIETLELLHKLEQERQQREAANQTDPDAAPPTAEPSGEGANPAEPAEDRPDDDTN